MAAPRYLAFLVPVGALALAVALRRPDRRTRGAALFAFTAAGIGIAVLNAVAGWAHWWSYTPSSGSFQGVPVDLWIGWAVLWGALPTLFAVPMMPALAGLALLDAVAMPRLAPVVHLGPHWLIGEAAGLVGVALPSLLLGRWMATRRYLAARATLQLVTFGGLTVWLLPSIGIGAGDGSWSHLTELPRWAVSLLVQLAGLVAVPGVLAVREFAERGRGHAVPVGPAAAPGHLRPVRIRGQPHADVRDRASAADRGRHAQLVHRCGCGLRGRVLHCGRRPARTRRPDPPARGGVVGLPSRCAGVVAAMAARDSPGCRIPGRHLRPVLIDGRLAGVADAAQRPAAAGGVARAAAAARPL